MATGLLLGLFLLKHWVLTFVVDFDYATGTPTLRRRWLAGLYLHCVAEGLVSAVLLWSYSWKLVSTFLLLEHLVLITSMLMERNASLTTMLRTYVRCELFVGCFYWVCVLSL